MDAQAILIFEWTRPNYLRICLDSLAHCHDIASWRIIASIDAGNHAPFEPLGCELMTWDSHAGNLWHITRSIERAFSMGFSRILFMDGDCILRRDALSNLPDQPDHALLTSMCRADEPRLVPWLTPHANILHADKAAPLLAYVNARSWEGKERPGHPDRILDHDYPGYDAVFCRYLIDHSLNSLYRDRSYVGHIGVCGVDCHAPHIESKLFEGDPSTWLANAARLFNPDSHFAFTPPDFVYD